MVFSRKIAERNRVGLNRFARHIADRLPGFGIVIHRGRRSGREFRTPLNVFRADDGFVIALTYGPDADWVKNVLAGGGCDLLTRGRRYALTNPRVGRDETRRHMPKVFVSQVLALADVKDFLYLDRVR
ncbi:nitroreductase family deazaflavin-dependent oxidoreductase [Microlunatus parietis]|uniref:Deazaflavin-dependent oxidoreductase (Nitroreductase family) n=1 Tax=Microlunatus parietis TaxID=682979 RepID=A0A7Y9LD92_9ACTN|nr:nitroreductase family deazaflavin-dependent oxidoreductase [Microlunatus parietis]NYE73652.1 deazaflavin-dependent oxidoreductase (nitroreductase family) [Microlunatus parietis]